MLADDDFEATVFEEAPAAPAVDTARQPARIRSTTRWPRSTDGDDERGGGRRAATAPRGRRDDGARAGPAGAAATPSRWTRSVLAAPPAPTGQDDWVVTNVARAVRALDDDGQLDADGDEGSAGDDGTPIEGVIAAAPALPVVESAFVAGEIDVPTPPPERDTTPRRVHRRELDPRGREPLEPADPDTGSRTPPLERR